MEGGEEEFGGFEKKLEGEPVLTGEILALEDAGFFGFLKLLTHDGEKLFDGGVGETKEVPVITAEFGGLHDGSEAFVKFVIVQELLDTSEFF